MSGSDMKTNNKNDSVQALNRLVPWGCRTTTHLKCIDHLQTADPITPLLITSDSRYVVDGLTKHLTTWEDTGWFGIQNLSLFQAAAYHLRRRAAPTVFKWTKGHDNNEGNDGADMLASEGARKPTDDHIDLTIPGSFHLPGAKLTAISQALAYRGILNTRSLKYSRSALMHLDILRHAIGESTQRWETDATIWERLRHPDIRKPIQNFLYL